MCTIQTTPSRLSKGVPGWNCAGLLAIGEMLEHLVRVHNIERVVVHLEGIGIDASAAVIEEARRDAGAGPNVEFSVGDL